MITDYFMITEKSNRLQVIMITDYNYPISGKYMSLKINIKDASDKLKGTFVSLVNSGIIHENGLHPLSCQKIYKCIVLPKALYGCENWNSMTESDVLTIERAHRFCIKYMQGLHRQTRTDIALSMIAIYSIESEIDFKKLILLVNYVD